MASMSNRYKTISTNSSDLNNEKKQRCTELTTLGEDLMDNKENSQTNGESTADISDVVSKKRCPCIFDRCICISDMKRIPYTLFFFFLLVLISGGILGYITHSDGTYNKTCDSYPSSNHVTSNFYCAKHETNPELSQAAELPQMKGSIKGDNDTKELKEKRLNFLVLGDWGRDGLCCQLDVAAEMSLAASKLNAQFVINVGDNFYPYGITSTKSRQIETSWENVYLKKYSSLSIPWLSVLGNHDYISNPQAQVDLTTKNTFWHMPSRYFKMVPPGALDMNLSIEMFFIDTTPFIEVQEAEKNNTKSTKITEQKKSINEQISWLKKVLKNSNAIWKIVVGHHPVYVCFIFFQIRFFFHSKFCT
eukprot:GSMAST32.ASY1.ANO1.737.1 assembled CDS